MERVTSRMALFPGCTLESSSIAFETSLTAVFRALDIPCPMLQDWNCCGASSAHALDHKLHLALNLRNLALAEEQGYSDLLVPCAACYHRLACTAFELDNDAELLGRLNAETGLKYRGGVAVRNVLDFLTRDVGVDAIAAHVTEPLTGLKVACYYGCLNTRVPRMESFDDREYPTSMDEIVRVLGAEALDWSYKTECCGASLFITAESVSARLVSRILKDAVAREAECIVIVCPMCQNNLDTKQAEIRAEFGIARPMPVVFITQLIGLAFGLAESELKLNQSFVPLEMVGK